MVSFWKKCEWVNQSREEVSSQRKLNAERVSQKLKTKKPEQNENKIKNECKKIYHLAVQTSCFISC